MATKTRVPNEFERQILQKNGIDPDKVGVQHSQDNYIMLLNYKTRDNITIHQGDRKW